MPHPEANTVVAPNQPRKPKDIQAYRDLCRTLKDRGVWLIKLRADKSPAGARSWDKIAAQPMEIDGARSFAGWLPGRSGLAVLDLDSSTGYGSLEKALVAATGLSDPAPVVGLSSSSKFHMIYKSPDHSISNSNFYLPDNHEKQCNGQIRGDVGYLYLPDEQALEAVIQAIDRLEAGELPEFPDVRKTPTRKTPTNTGTIATGGPATGPTGNQRRRSENRARIIVSAINGMGIGRMRRTGDEWKGPCPVCSPDDPGHCTTHGVDRGPDGKCGTCGDTTTRGSVRISQGNRVYCKCHACGATNANFIEALDLKKERQEKSAKILLEQVTDLGFAYRLNARTDDVELRWTGDGDPPIDCGDGTIGAWWSPGDVHVLALQYACNEKYGYTWGRDSFYNAYKGAGGKPGLRVDPFKVWLESLPEWDGEERINWVISDVFKGVGPSDPLAIWASRFLFLGPIQRTYDPGCLLRDVPVLIGPQKSGKSSLLLNLFDPDRVWSDFSATFNCGRYHGEKELLEGVGTAALVEFDEFVAGDRALVEKLKSVISRRADRARMAFGREFPARPRRWVTVATTNETEPLPNDPSGNTRFVTLELGVGRFAVESYLKPIREQLWAEAMWRHQEEGTRANLPRELDDLRDTRNESHRYHHEYEDLAHQHLDPAYKYRMEDIKKRFDLPPLTNANIVGKALRGAGWEAFRDRVEGKRCRMWRKKGTIDPILYTHTDF